VATSVQVCFDLAASSTNVQTLLAVEDATVSSATPGSVVTPDTDLSCGPDDGNIYLKFTVPDPLGKIKKARVILTASSAPSSDGDGGDLFFVADNTWSEKTITWNTAPKTVPPALGQILGVVLGGAYPVDVTSRITGKGTYSFALTALTSGGTNGSHFLSKEASTTAGPKLVIEYNVVDGDGDTYPDGPDCNDANASVHPGAQEQCNGVDDDCDGVIDEGCGSAGAGGGPDASPDGAGATGGVAGQGHGGGANYHAVSESDDSGGGCNCVTVHAARTHGAWAGAALAAWIVVRRRTSRQRR